MSKPADNRPSPSAELSESTIAFMDGRFMPLSEARLSIAAHVVNYGTGVFEGIRGYWNEAERQLYLFRCLDHFVRLAQSCRLLRIGLPDSPEGLVTSAIGLIRANEFASDVYIRPLAYKSGRVMKVALSGIRDGFAMYAFDVGPYLPIGGLKAAVTTWRRISDNAIPARAKATGAYINTSLAVDEVGHAGADEAIFLTQDGHVSEGGGANLFMVRDHVLVTPPVSSDILEGITRESIKALAREEGFEVVERPIDRTELYVADELFFSGTGAQIAPCVIVDDRQVGSGEIGPVSRVLASRYFATVRGEDDSHPEWLLPVYDR